MERKFIINEELKDKVEQLTVDLQITKSLFVFVDEYIADIPDKITDDNLYKIQSLCNKSCQMCDTSYVVLKNLDRITKQLDQCVEEILKCKVER